MDGLIYLVGLIVIIMAIFILWLTVRASHDI
jgi:hypothetical protein